MKKSKNLDRVALGRVAQACLDYAQQRGVSIERVADELEVGRGTIYNMVGAKPQRSAARRAMHLPRSATLRRLSEVTGRSVDWLLGFDVPELRSERQQIGDLGREVLRELRECMPEGAPVDLLNAQRGSAAVVEEIGSLWWAARLREAATLWESRLRRLADKVERLASELPEAAGFETEVFARYCRNGAVILREPDVTWGALSAYQRVGFFELVHGRSARQQELDQQPLRSTWVLPWRVAGPFTCVFSYVGDEVEAAAWIDPKSGQVESRVGAYVFQPMARLDLTMQRRAGGGS